MTDRITARRVGTHKDPMGGEQRFYKLSRGVSKTVSGLFRIEEELAYCKKNLSEKHAHIVPEGASEWDLICISDAHTHPERLIFLGCEYEPGKFSRLNSLQLDGVMTMMIHGGDWSTMRPDKVYLRRLASVNGFYFAGIEPAA